MRLRIELDQPGILDTIDPTMIEDRLFRIKAVFQYRLMVSDQLKTQARISGEFHIPICDSFGRVTRLLLAQIDALNFIPDIALFVEKVYGLIRLSGTIHPDAGLPSNLLCVEWLRSYYSTTLKR